MEAFKVCPNNEIPEISMNLAIEELYLKKSFEDAGFYFMSRLFGNKHVHKDAFGRIFMDNTPIVIISAL
ncbi:MAG: hypothetical protein ACR5KV_06900 [Wolbachia sp.]